MPKTGVKVHNSWQFAMFNYTEIMNCVFCLAVKQWLEGVFRFYITLWGCMKLLEGGWVLILSQTWGDCQSCHPILCFHSDKLSPLSPQPQLLEVWLWIRITLGELILLTNCHYNFFNEISWEQLHILEVSIKWLNFSKECDHILLFLPDFPNHKRAAC